MATRRSLGSISKKSNGVWLVRVTLPSNDGKQRRKNKTVRGSKRDAEAVLNKMLMEAGQYEGEATFEEFCARYVEWHDQVYTRPDAQAKWHRDMKRLVGEFGPMTLNSMRRDVMEVWAMTLNSMRRDVMEVWATKPTTTSHMVNKMKAALQKAVEWEYLDRNPLMSVKPHRAAPTKDRFTEEESRMILDAVRGSDIEAIVLLMLMCGMRREEAMALDWKDIDFKTGIVKIDRSWHYDHGRGWMEDTKNASSRRIVTIDRITLSRLSEIRSSGHVTRIGAICVSPRSGERMAPNTASLHWRDIARPLLGDRYLPMKNLRHTHASLCLDAGVSMESIAKRLGHSSTRLTESVYASSDTIQQDCADAMGVMFG